jgi:hypothetical protein
VQVLANACSASLRVALRQAFAMDSPTFYLFLLQTRGGCKGLAVAAALSLWEFCRVQTLWQLLAAAAVAGWVGQ